MYSLPTVSDFKLNFQRDFPFAVPAYGAAALATIVAGVVSTLTVIGGGIGYVQPPTVTITPGPGDTTGSGATATCAVLNGAVSTIAIVTGGTNYTVQPIVSFAGGAGDNSNLKKVTDTDIQGAIFDADFNCNPGLFPTQQAFSRAFLYLAAHQLCQRFLMAAAGLQSQYEWLTTAKSVGDVSQSFAFPKRLLEDSPWLADFSKTRYGAMYLQIVGPLLVGNVGIAPTFTNP